MAGTGEKIMKLNAKCSSRHCFCADIRYNMILCI